MDRWRTLASLLLATTLLGGCHGVSEAELDAIEQVLALPAGSTLADIGAGDGDYLAFYADLAGSDGQVLATEIDPGLLEALAERVADEGLDNVRVVEATISATGLAEGCCDAIVLRHVYHHLTEPQATLADVHRALKTGGTLLVIDFAPTGLLSPWQPEGLPDDRSGHGIAAATVSAEAAAAGFQTAASYPEWPGGHLVLDHFAVVLKKADGG